MNKKLLFSSKIVSAALTLSTMFGSSNLFAQTTQVRSYATRQGNSLAGIDVLGSVSGLSNAVDTDPYTSGTLTLGIGIGATRTLYMDFNPSPSATTSYATTIAANTPITVKFTLPAGLVGALSNLQISAITNLHQTLGTWSATDVGTVYTGSSLVGLLSGSGSIEYTITPTAAFQGIRISISSLASVAASINVFDAYIKTSVTSANCGQIVDGLSGVRAGTLALANATGSVTNLTNAYDNSLTTFSTVTTGAQVLSQVYQTAIFNSPSKVGDSVQLVIQDASSALLNLGVMAGLKINLYNGSNGNPVQTVSNDSTNLLTLNLLNPVGNIYTLSFVPTAIFDRIELQLGGVTGALQSLRVYEMGRKNAGVSLTIPQKDVYAYAGNNIVLSGTGIATGDTVNYYTALTGGVQLTSNVVPTVLSSTTTVTPYYAGATRPGCSDASERSQINAHVIGFTFALPTDGTVGAAYSSDVAVTPATGSTMPAAASFRYRTTSTLPPGLALDSLSGMITGTPTTSNSFPLLITVVDAANNLPVGTFSENITITSTPLATSLANFSGVAQGNDVSLNWQMAQTLNVKGYQVERSLDGRVFSAIGYVANTASVNNYNFVDNKVANGTNYYRIKVIFNSGSYDYSKVINMELKADPGITIFPNPVTDGKLFVKGNNVKSIVVTNALGQNITVPVIASGDVQEISTQSLAKGFYFINVRQQNGATTSYRFVVK